MAGERLTRDQIVQRVAERTDETERQRAAAESSQYRYAHSLRPAANDLIDWMSNRQSRLMFGLSQMDAAMRGIGQGELCYITGKAHSGKTQLLLQLVAHQPEAHLLYITPDEVDNIILAKLISSTHGVNPEELERRIRRNDNNAVRLVRQTVGRFSGLRISDSALTFHQMSEALKEAEDQWGAKCDGVLIDYLDLLPGDADYNGTKGKSVNLKRWTKENSVACVCVHQPKRGGAFRGDKIGMDDLNQGGETEATFVLGVYRKRDDVTLAWDERERHDHTISVNLDKNKRPPCHTGQYDYFLDPVSGQVRELRPGDQVLPGERVSALVALDLHERAQQRQTDKVIEMALRRQA